MAHDSSHEPATERRERASKPPVLFWIIGVAALVSLGGGATLLALSQSEVLGPNGANGPGFADETYTTGQAVNIWWRERWNPGTIKQKDGDRYLVGYRGAASARDEWVDATRLQPRPAPAP